MNKSHYISFHLIVMFIDPIVKTTLCMVDLFSLCTIDLDTKINSQTKS